MSSSIHASSVPDDSQRLFTQVRELVADDLAAVDQLIIKQLSSDVLLINQIGQYIVSGGGKRLRPILLLLASRALGYQGIHHLTLAAVIEFIHTATLLHDDVVDESSLRRGRDTVNNLWGNAASVLVGDYLYSRSFEMMVTAQNLRIMEILSRTTTAIAEGEVLQLLNCNNAATTEEAYLQVISRKTAILFSAAGRLAAVLSGADVVVEQAMSAYGQHLGTAFQLIDDVLDYKANPQDLGKNLGDDLAEGKPTLPLIYALQQSDEQQAAVLRRAIEAGDRDAFNAVYAIIQATDAITYTEQRAEEEARKAAQCLDGLPASCAKDAMIALADFSIARNY
ncbi:MAG: octaprenyl diphosphate synthase [Methylococcaceae bacterium]|nr:MAG: octaprenyl diphosphate synthase [Methylococcaceae bacterium]